MSSEERFLHMIMRGLSNIVYNVEHGGATKEQIVSSLKSQIKEYNEIFGKDLK